MKKDYKQDTESFRCIDKIYALGPKCLIYSVLWGGSMDVYVIKNYYDYITMAEINYCPQSDCGLAGIWIISLICKFLPKERDEKKETAQTC